MNLMKKASAALAVASLVAMPVAASAARVETSVAADSEYAGGSVVLALLAAVAIGGGIYLAVDANDDEPVSA